MNKLVLIAAAFVASTLSLSAQIVKGDMNGDGQLTVADLSNTASRILESAPLEYISTGVNPYQADNSLILGKWYRTKKSWLEFKADGSIESQTDGSSYTNELYDVIDTINVSDKTYIFMPYQGRVLFCNKKGIPESFTNIYQMTDDYIVMGTGKRMAPLYKSQPIVLVNNITLSQNEITLKPDESVRITATVLPTDADDTSVTWLSDNNNVANVMGGIILAIGEGTANITCKANDGSGVVATCKVTVSSAASHEYVDLGLSVKWATCNIGAEKPEDYGLYFAWGETTGYTQDTSDGHQFNWANYKWCNGSKDTMTKYCTSSSYGEVDNKRVLDPEDDAAHVNWGGSWRMPTRAEQHELGNNCTWTWTTQNGVKGYKVTSKSNGNSIFLPAAGYRSGDYLSNAGSYSDYWSSSLNTANLNYAYCLYFNSSSVDWSYQGRCRGQSVRPVCQ